jgi:hypothetical protein
MTERAFSNRFELKTRERLLVRQFEIAMSGCDMSRVALVDVNTRHDLVFFCQNDDDTDHVWHIWCMNDEWEDQTFSYDSYDEAAQRFDLWSNEPLQPNWDAQAEYDEMNGTINGEDAGIVMMRELWDE